jgi:hypothetical protein
MTSKGLKCTCTFLARWALLAQLGTPAAAPKPRGKSPGRQVGQTQTARPRFSVVKKGKYRKAKAPIVA